MRRIILIVGIAFLTSSLVSCQARSRPEPVPSGSDKPKVPGEPETPAKDEKKDNHESPWDSIGLRVETGRFGVTVTEVRKNSPAAEAGIMEGDYIDKIGDSYVNTTAGFNAAIRSRKAGEQIVITRSTKDGEVKRFGWDPSLKKREKP
jgi:predicted metalloprotease with PDZ domain